MCGVFGYIGYRKNASKIVFEGIKALEYRGYDSWGEAIFTDSKLLIIKKTGKISGQAPKVTSSLSLGHTRWATHGGVTIANSHPHTDCHRRFALIHNGIIENFDKIKAQLLKKGHCFLSETDSEAAAHLIEENLKNLPAGRQEEKDFWPAFLKSFQEFEGLNAIVILDKKTELLYALKKGSPLVVGFGKNENFIASDASAIIPYTNKVYFLEDNEGVILKKEGIKFFNLKKNQWFKPEPVIIPWSKQSITRGRFRHFMLKEIFEQPKILENILVNSGSQIESLAKIIKKSYGTYLVGCGTAGHACLFGQYLFSKVAKRHVNFSYGSEFGYLVDFLTEKSLVIALSQSGETIDIIESIDKAKEKGAKIAALVNVLGSTLYRKADYKLLLLAGPEKAVAATKSFTAKLATLVMLAYGLNGGFNKAKEELKSTIKEVNKILKNLSVIKKLAKEIFQKEHLYIIGRGLSYPIALEAALKIKEISYIHAEGLAAGELKHGTIALIEKGTPCLVFSPNDETYGAVISGAMELKARGGYIIGVAENNRPEIFDYFIEIKDLGPATAISQTVVSQLLSYYLGIERGCEIDKPRNLAKSVTVK